MGIYAITDISDMNNYFIISYRDKECKQKNSADFFKLHKPIAHRLILQIVSKISNVNLKIFTEQYTARYDDNRKCFTHLEIWTASGKNYLVGLKISTLCRKGTIDQRAAFEECVEVLYERALVVVPPETELLVVLHGSSGFVPSFLYK